MSGGLLTNYSRENVDLAGFFPPYEWCRISFSLSLNENSNTTQTYTSPDLIKNADNNTNYMVLYNVEITNFTAPNAQDALLCFQSSFFVFTPPITYNRTSTKFSLTIRYDNVQTIFFPVAQRSAITASGFIYCLVIYPYSSTQSYITNSSYSTNSSDLVNFFPQYLYSQNNLNVANNNNWTQTISLAAKNSLSTDYFRFGSFSDPASSFNNINTNIMYYTIGQSASSFEIRIRNPTSYTGMNVDTLVLYPQTPIQENNVTTDYTTKINGIDYNLVNIFPLYETFQDPVANSSPYVTFTKTLTKNARGNTNYFVITSYVYSSAGTAGTYDAWEGSTAAYSCYILNKTSTNFIVVMRKTTGENWNGGIRYLVIYY
jgi:hypothetical protein